MKKVYPLLAAAMFAGNIAAPILANSESLHTGGTKSAYEHEHKTSGKEFKGGYTTMEGTVSKIDHNKGTLDLKTQDGTVLSLHFPAEVIKSLKEGDQETIQTRSATFNKFSLGQDLTLYPSFGAPFREAWRRAEWPILPRTDVRTVPFFRPC
jgi:hypothetical protein